ncbi:hypothetical protein ZIOFF_013193 [Zingiber officinale]|uniref:Uncharacterized protein n=1 Tax=Zingiber officinale TaxID=94328 RepID=A0A8J5LKQ2_ZINOF|nr:hypothetical protein ZIOFF_013193 [Zingiber officinale]
MAEPKVSTVIITVDLKSWNSTATIKWALCKLMMWFKTNSIVFDEKKNTVTVTGPFDPQHFIQQLCSLAGSVALVAFRNVGNNHFTGWIPDQLKKMNSLHSGDKPAAADFGFVSHFVFFEPTATDFSAFFIEADLAAADDTIYIYYRRRSRSRSRCRHNQPSSPSSSKQISLSPTTQSIYIIEDLEADLVAAAELSFCLLHRSRSRCHRLLHFFIFPL